MRHPLGNHGHLQPLGKEGSKPGLGTCWAVDTLAVCQEDHPSPRTHKQRGGKGSVGAALKHRNEHKAWCFITWWVGGGDGWRDGWMGGT